jgi:hypothetical protein
LGFILNKQEDQEFTHFLREKVAEAKRDFGFPGTKFLAMLNADGGYKTAQTLLARRVPSDGFTELWRHKRLDLTVEALVVESKWRRSFDPLLIHNAESLLRKSGYSFTPYGVDSIRFAELDATKVGKVDDPAGSTRVEVHPMLDAVRSEAERIECETDQHEAALRGRTDIGDTTKEQLVRARRGQGVFKANVRLNEKGCRVTGITDPVHLRASHIKPWKDSTDEEKLHGCNGLLLAPHIDHLFDRGLISFSHDGALLISKRLDQSVLLKWNISVTVNTGLFNSQQAAFLEYHKNTVFKD